MSSSGSMPRTRLGRTLGEGTFAKVKFATNTHTGAPVAIKIIDRDRVLCHQMVEQIKREISTMKMIEDPNVLNLFEVMASRTKIYIVHEYVDGGELFDKIAKYGKLQEDAARRYFQQLINAVDYCHSRGIYQRDLKEDGLLHTAFGTPNYVAPEVLTDKGYDGTSSDVWSCGVILFVLMAGYLPFDEPSLMALYRRIQKANFLFPSWFSSSAKKLIKHILDPNPLTEEEVSLDDVDAVFNDSEENLVTERKEKPVSMNAFQLISRSQGFSLENLFDNQMGLVKRETCFTSKHLANEIMSKIEEAAKPLGFNVHKKNFKMKLQGDKTGRKGQLAVATEVLEVAPSLHMVELRKTGGDTLEFHKA
ncbi:UNVERIFIED_CONTAM: CBL-interacting serine/threonine-protein kinase [Sesamum latifolium]|uniref:non-specific serine/threonine protein kinase n=1 Tax=Sesamum latifolium TaxID=2727402 RepID=A0AAW2XX73_9LAMI